MESPIVENSNPPQETSKIFGILGFVLSLMGLVLAAILRKSIIGLIVVGVFLILGLIFSIIQRKKAKTGLSTAGLIISIIGIILVLFFLLIAPFILSSMMGNIDEELDRQVASGLWIALVG